MPNFKQPFLTIVITFCIVIFSSYGKAQLPKYIPILVGDKYGFCDSNMNMLIEPQYDDVDFWGESKAYFYKNDEKYYIDLTSGNINKVVAKQPLYNLEIKADSIYIISSTENTVICSLPFNKAYSKQIGLEIADTINQIFFLDYYKGEKYIVTDIVSKKGVIHSFTKLLDYQYTTWKNFFVSKQDSLYSIYKISESGVTKVSRHDYAYISPPNKSGIFKAIRATPLTIFNETITERRNKVKTITRKFHSSIYFIDTLGNEILKIPKDILKGDHEYYVSYVGSAKYTLETDSLNEFLIYNNYEKGYEQKFVIFKDSLTNTWQNIEIPTFANTSEIIYSTPFPIPALFQRVGKNLIVYKNSNLRSATHYYYQLVNTQGRLLLPKTYWELRIYNDSMLHFMDSTYIGIITTYGKEILKVNRFSDSIVYNLWAAPNNIFGINMYHKSGDATKTINQLYKWDGNRLISMDYDTYQKRLKEIDDSIKANTPLDTYWILRDKKVRAEFNYDTRTYNIYCDSLLINPNMQIVEYTNHYDVLFIMKDKHNHTWIYDNNGQVVYNTDADYEYKVQYLTSGKVNHFVITITTRWRKKRNKKFIADIRWPGFNGHPLYSDCPIEQLIDSFTLINTKWYYDHDLYKQSKYGVYNELNELIIPPLFGYFSYLKIANTTTKYLFFVSYDEYLRSRRKTGFLFNGDGDILFDNVIYTNFNTINQHSPYRNFYEMQLKQSKKIYIDKYGTIYYISTALKED